MEFAEVVRRRRMVRHFTEQPVPWETVRRLVRTAQHAPSAGYAQGVSFVAVTDAVLRARVAEIAGEAWYTEVGHPPFISSAPVHLVLCTSEAAYRARYREADKLKPDREEREWPVPYWYSDAGSALMMLLLAAVNEGLVAAFVGARDPALLRDLLGIPSEVMPLGIVLIGYAAPDRRTRSARRGRKPVDEVLHREHW